MAKRLSDTDKWKDPWFDNLSGPAKLFFFFYLDNCDCAGIWKGIMRHYTSSTGFSYSIEQMLIDFDGKIEKLPNHSFFMEGFLKFQYGKLNPMSNIHKGVLKSLKYNNIETKAFEMVQEEFRTNLNENEQTSYDSESLMNKNKNMDKNKALNMDLSINTSTVLDVTTGVTPEGKINPDLVIALFNKICSGQGKIETYRSFSLSGNALTDFVNRYGSPGYQLTGIWEELFRRVSENEFLCGEDKKTQFVATLPWILKPDNFEVIISGGYPSTRKIKKPSDEPPEGVDYDTWYRSQPQETGAKL